MKSTDLEKNKGLKLVGQLKQSKTPDRFGQGAAAVTSDRRTQRKLDQAQGLIPFSVKLKQSLVDEIRARAQQSESSINDVVAELLESGLKNQSAKGE